MTPDHPRSYYAASANPAPRASALDGPARCDVCVVGAGYTGLSAALTLAERGRDVLVLEQARIGWGASGRNGGQMASGQRQDQVVLERWYGMSTARALWDLAEAAKRWVRARIDRHGIACDYRPGVLHVGHRPRHARAEQRYAEYLRARYGYDAIRPVDRAELATLLASPMYHGGSLDLGAGHLHPLNYALGLAHAGIAAGARLHERSGVTRIEPGTPMRIVTRAGVVEARDVILACNGYLDGLVPALERRVMPINNFIAATAPLEPAAARALIRDDVAVADSRFVVRYFRLSADRRLLFGGGENYARDFPADIAEFVRPHLTEVFPQLGAMPIDYAWGGTLAITVNRMPHVGVLDEHLYFAQGYSGHGVAIASLTGELIADALCGDRSRFDVLARRPPPPFPGGRWLRHPLRVLAMLYYALRDRL